jgi:quercetin dioxygenase-like cupin family protein
MRTFRRVVIAGTIIAGVALAAQAVQASPPGPGLTGRLISKETVGGKDYILREITLPPGQSTGWQYNDGTLYGLVKQGTLSHFDASRKPDGVYRTGSIIVQPSGSDHAHFGANLGGVPLIIDVLYVDPVGSPLSEDAPKPGCHFQ